MLDLGEASTSTWVRVLQRSKVNSSLLTIFFSTNERVGAKVEAVGGGRVEEISYNYFKETYKNRRTILPADSEVRYEHCHRHSLCAIRLLYAVTKDLHVLVLWAGHVLQVHEAALEPRRSCVRSGDVQGRVSRMKRIGSAEVQSVPGQSTARVPSQPIWEPTFARGGD
ncbi:hypothetical protein X777_14049 [Ooceraea biroi]|uniref:Uncharacterized protein n=1 Tax=Ooceraea biroi TaxID=2015173 RepID=A0A026VZ86_OOCBI|nr:hypothetical protein X777_14049 [Ooceraea biroi]